MEKEGQSSSTSVEANGDSVDSVNIVTEKPSIKSEPSKSNSVQDLINKIKNDPELSDTGRLDTLSLLVMTFVKENSILQSEINMANEQTKKHIEAKQAIKDLNDFLKKQISLMKEEGDLRLQEQKSMREESSQGYQKTINELSKLFEIQANEENSTNLKEQNQGMTDKMLLLLKETEKREGQVEKKKMECQLQIKLLEHQVAKAQIEKAEIKADMTKDRLGIMHELAAERERGEKLEETLKLLKEQADLYQAQMLDLQKGGADNSKSFQLFKTQIEKLTTGMVQLEKQTVDWKQKSEKSSSQVKKMKDTTQEKEKELTQLNKKLESMVKLNKTLNAERVTLLEKIKKQGV